MNSQNVRVLFATIAAALLLTAVPARSQATLTSIVAPLGGIASPTGGYTDVYGNIFVVTATTAYEIPANGRATITLYTGLTTGRGIAADSFGNVYISQTTATTVIKLPAGGGASTTVGSGLSTPFLMAVDAANNLYVVDSRNLRIVEIAAGTGAQTVVTGFTGALNGPHGIAIDAAGDIFVSNFNTNSILELPAGASASLALPVTGLSSHYGIAVDTAGNLYEVDEGTGRLLEFPGATGAPVVLQTGLGTLAASVNLNARGDIQYSTAKFDSLQNGAANFYGVAVGTTSAPIALTYTFASAVTLGAPVLTANNGVATIFASATGTTCTNNKAITAGTTCVLDVAFAPTQAGSVTGTVSLYDKTGNLLITTNVAGSGTAPVPAFAPGTSSTYLNSLGAPAGLALDAGGALYIADTAAGTVRKATAASTSTALGFTGLVRPYGVAVDGGGNVFVSDSSANAVYELNIHGIQSTLPLTGLNVPQGIALDSAGDIFIADSANSRIVKLDIFGRQSAIPFTGLAAPSAVAVDMAGDIFIADTGKVLEYNSAGVQSTFTTTGLITPTALAVSASGTLFIADAANGNVYVLTSGSAAFTLGSGFSSPGGIAVAPSGNVFVADTNHALIALIDRTKDAISFPVTATNATSASITTVVQNIGNAILNYSALTVSASFAQVASGSTDCSATSTVAAGSLCNIAVTFNPTAAGSNITGTVTQTDNALNAAISTQQIQLSGTAELASTTALGLTTPATGNPIYGQSFTVTATVAPASGAGTPTGTVIFTLDGTAQPAVTLTGSKTTFSIATLAAGPHIFTAAYSGDATYAPSAAGSFTVTVVPAVLHVTADALSRVYAAANPALTYTITGFVNGDALSVVTGTPVLSTTATATSAPGPYTITVTNGTLAAANYTFTPVNGTLTISKASNTITFPAIANRTYGAVPVTLAATATSGLPVTYTVTSGPATISGSTVTITGAGTITIAANQPGDTNYVAAAAVPQSFTVAPALLTLTANNLSKQSGEVNPALTYTITGFVNADTQTSATTGAPSLTTTATATSSVGPYPITITQGSFVAANYTLALVNGALTVTGTQSQTITFNPIPNTTYGTGTVLPVATASSGAAVTYTVTGPATISGSSILIAGAGTIAVTASQSGNNTYAAATPVTQTFTVAPAVLNVTASNLSKTINTPNPTLTYTITGFVNGDTQIVVAGTPALSTTATLNSPVGPYPITLTQGTLAAANYIFTTAGGTLTVNAATQTIAFAPLAAVTYGVTPLTLTATASSSLPVTYTVTGPATVSGSTLTITGAGTVVITAAQAGSATYAAATSVTQNLTVNRAPLLVSADTFNLYFSQAVPTLTYTATGLVNGDTKASLSGAPVLTTSAISPLAVGQYAVTIAQGTLSTPNYLLSFANGSIVVTPAPQTILFGALANIPQSTAFTISATPVITGTTTLTGLPVTFSVTAGTATITPIGTTNGVTTASVNPTSAGTITITASQAGNANYATAPSVAQTFTSLAGTTTALTISTNNANLGATVSLVAKVTPKTTGITPTGNATFMNGTAVVGTAPLVNGSATLSTTALPGGSLSLTAVYQGDATYAASTSPAQIILIISPDYNITASASNLTIAAGQSASTVITVTPLGGYQQAIKFSCGSLPENITCNFSPEALDFFGTGAAFTLPQSTTLTITAMSSSARMEAPSSFQNATAKSSPALAALCFGTPLSFLALLYARRRRPSLRSEIRLFILLAITIVTLGTLSGCGSKASPYPVPGTYTIPVTFVDGTSIDHVFNLTVTIPQ